MTGPRGLAVACLVLATAPAAAQDAPIALAEVTCAQVASAYRLSVRHIAAAALGARAARAGQTRFSAAAIDAAEQAITAGCAQDGAGERRIRAIVASLPPVPEAARDLDLATLTCLGLAPQWRQVARSLVPFMVAWRDAAADTPLTRQALDQVGEGLPRICRDAANQDRKVSEMVAELR